VADLIEGILRMMQSKNFIGPVNLGNPGEFTVMELAQKVIELTNSRSKIIAQEKREDDPTRRRPDISLAQQKLGWQPQIPLRDGLQKTIAYFDGLLREG